MKLEWQWKLLYDEILYAPELLLKNFDFTIIFKAQEIDGDVIFHICISCLISFQLHDL